MQNAKTLGIIRGQWLKTMFGLFSDTSLREGTETPYGVEFSGPTGPLVASLSTGAGIIGLGALTDPDSGPEDGLVSLGDREAYRLLWRPWGAEEYDYTSKTWAPPMGSGGPVGRLARREKVFIAHRVGGLTPGVIAEAEYDGVFLTEFEVISAINSVQFSVPFYSALIARVEGVPLRVLSLGS